MPHKSKKALERFHNRNVLKSIAKEMKMNPPEILGKTKKKKGKKAAEKQRVAILLSKARKKGVKI